MAVPQTITTTVLDNKLDGIASPQTPGAMALILNGTLVSGGVAILAEAQKISLKFLSENTGIDFVLVGSDADGHPLTDVVPGASVNDSIASIKHFKTVTSITPSSSAGVLTAGVVIDQTSGVTRTLRVNRNQTNFKVGFYVDLSPDAVLNYSVQYSADWPESGRFPPTSASYSSEAYWRDVDGLSGFTSPNQGNIAFPIECVRLLVKDNSVGTATLTVQQGY